MLVSSAFKTLRRNSILYSCIVINRRLISIEKTEGIYISSDSQIESVVILVSCNHKIHFDTFAHKFLIK